MNRLDPAIVLGGVLICAGMGCAQIIGIEDLPDAEDMADSGTCMPACMDDTLQVCAPEPTLVPCPLGCNADGDACRTVVPSNGAELGHLQGVSRALLIPTSPDPQTLASIDTDTGRIRAGSMSMATSCAPAAGAAARASSASTCPRPAWSSTRTRSSAPRIRAVTS